MTTEDTSGFYKLEDGNWLSWAKNLVSGPSFQLSRVDHEKYTYPIEGWYWFDSEENAKKFFNIPESPQTPQTGLIV